MSAPVPINEPMQLRAGDTWVWNCQDLADNYPAPTWELKYAFKNALQHFEITAAADGAFFAINVPMATTAPYVAGKYRWASWVETATERYDIDRGWLTVLPVYNNAATLDDRTHARRVLDAIEAVIENRATMDQQKYTIGSRSLDRMPVKDLLEFRALYRGQVFAEDAGERKRNGYGSGRIVVKF